MVAEQFFWLQVLPAKHQLGCKHVPQRVELPLSDPSNSLESIPTLVVDQRMMHWTPGFGAKNKIVVVGGKVIN
ncbi:hypothetical protein RA27_00240 [Ruegeria sp. ANG-R]|nr:hypothetical protein RA27_00240 [Ruegeria sp. ANG-R]